jgi:hypothetical protein
MSYCICVYDASQERTVVREPRRYLAG